jgi:hypothetical protein
MPRKSAEAIAGDWFRAQNAPPPPPHPEPPAYFSPAAAEHWRAIVASKPSTYFDAANRILLECVCVHAATADWIWGEIHTLDPKGQVSVSALPQLGGNGSAGEPRDHQFDDETPIAADEAGGRWLITAIRHQASRRCGGGVTRKRRASPGRRARREPASAHSRSGW